MKRKISLVYTHALILCLVISSKQLLAMEKNSVITWPPNKKTIAIAGVILVGGTLIAITAKKVWNIRQKPTKENPQVDTELMSMAAPFGTPTPTTYDTPSTRSEFNEFRLNIGTGAVPIKALDEKIQEPENFRRI